LVSLCSVSNGKCVPLALAPCGVLAALLTDPYKADKSPHHGLYTVRPWAALFTERRPRHKNERIIERRARARKETP